MKLRNWKLKGIVQNVLSLAPGGGAANDWLQRRAGGLKDFEGNIAAKAADWEFILRYLERVDRRVKGQVLLELGSGWYPTLPLCHSLAGAAAIHTVDIVRHMNEELTFRMLGALEPLIDRIASVAGVPVETVRSRYAALRNCSCLTNLLAAARIDYHAPEDARQLNLPDRSIDIFYSNSVLEHVEPALIPPIMLEARRVLKDNGLNVHAVACNDHYAHFDPSISFVNFLRFNDRQWRFWNNHLNYQNRLRAADYIRMTADAGFRIDYEDRSVRPGSREAVQSLPIAPEFRHYSSEDLATTSVNFVAVKAPGSVALQ